MKKKYVTVELEFMEFKLAEDAIMASTPLLGNGENDFTDDFGEAIL